MSGHDDLRLDAAGYALGTLAAEDRERFEAHLRECPECRQELAELERVARLGAEADPLPPLPPGLGARTLLAVEREAGGAAPATAPAPAPAAAPKKRRWPALPRLALAGAALAAVLLALVIARDPGAPGRLEGETALRAPGGGGQASADVFFTGIGRVIEFDTDDLPILPEGEYYEVWFVGPDDRRGAPDRISAGTFHPDEEGRSRVSLTAAVDPKKYPGVAVTAEPGDGDPAPAGADLLRGRVRLR
ncbi:MAG: hypothetical protein AVDCRST_MAG30-1020 [uncultured Solirubrobacteraceae bacterium]|uniref:Regulator of SigK n=1 Tax=uncultured Solirubrobacteraceae bacterium TaxID=1162706 RepID=A0A6J4S443_9ACTN|nr:MAG: hypothetical protein AVDCRST_MAG30-1020 [uncultured Solirubrobacteraceae bacterium]